MDHWWHKRGTGREKQNPQIKKRKKREVRSANRKAMLAPRPALSIRIIIRVIRRAFLRAPGVSVGRSGARTRARISYGWARCEGAAPFCFVFFLMIYGRSFAFSSLIWTNLRRTRSEAGSLFGSKSPIFITRRFLLAHLWMAVPRKHVSIITQQSKYPAQVLNSIVPVMANLLMLFVRWS